jgi:xanthine dehydrogenase iron-sulfur cluster and FAD-binding subunit A
MRAVEAEESLVGRPWDENTVRRTQEILERSLKPISDHRGSAAYRLALAQTLLEKFWWEQREEATA